MLPGIVPLGETHLIPGAQVPDHGLASLPTHALSYQKLLEAVARLSPNVCPSVVLRAHQFLQLSARLVGCGSLPPRGVTAEKVLSFIFSVLNSTHTLFSGCDQLATQ